MANSLKIQFKLKAIKSVEIYSCLYVLVSKFGPFNSFSVVESLDCVITKMSESKVISDVLKDYLLEFQNRPKHMRTSFQTDSKVRNNFCYQTQIAEFPTKLRRNFS